MFLNKIEFEILIKVLYSQKCKLIEKKYLNICMLIQFEITIKVLKYRCTYIRIQ
jgi:hypothetical protein